MRTESSKLVLAVVVSFLNERDYLPKLLASIETQVRLPDHLVLVDDGSTDGSHELAEQFAEGRPWVVARRRPPRPQRTDRLATASELKAFLWGLEHVDVPCDIVAKLDADLELRPSHFAEVCSLFEQDDRLGIAGAYLSIRREDGSVVREAHPPDHVRGPNKFYRRACLDAISPLPAYLGWDTIDEIRARMHGWRTTSVALSAGDSVHLRPTGAHDGRLRAFWRWGECAFGYGSHPLSVLAGGAARLVRPPYVISGAAYVLGWAGAQARSRPRVEPEARAFRRREELLRLRQLARAAAGRREPALDRLGELGRGSATPTKSASENEPVAPASESGASLASVQRREHMRAGRRA
jgi:poly-beta-1,6-N-acetyl-D-glucosamine synthase